MASDAAPVNAEPWDVRCYIADFGTQPYIALFLQITLPPWESVLQYIVKDSPIFGFLSFTSGIVCPSSKYCYLSPLSFSLSLLSFFSLLSSASFFAFSCAPRFALICT